MIAKQTIQFRRGTREAAYRTTAFATAKTEIVLYQNI